MFTLCINIMYTKYVEVLLICAYIVYIYICPEKKSETMTKDIYLNQPFFPVAGECRRASICFLLVYRTTSILSITSIFLYLKCIIYTLYKYVLSTTMFIYTLCILLLPIYISICVVKCILYIIQCTSAQTFLGIRFTDKQICLLNHKENNSIVL